MYCRKCWYDLRSIESGACPECGRAFDPAKPRTFDPILPRRSASLVALIVALLWAVLVQIVVLAARTLFHAWPPLLDGLGVAALLVAAGVVGWYASRPLVLAAAGLLGAGFVAVLALQNDRLRNWEVADLSPITKGAALAGLWLVFAVATPAAGAAGWRLHAWWHRFRAAHELAFLPRPRTVVLVTTVLVLLLAGWATRESARVMRGTPVIAVDYDERFERRRADAAGVADAARGDSHAAWSDLVRLEAEADRLVREGAATAQANRPGRDTGKPEFAYVTRYASLPADVDRERRVLAEMREIGLFDDLRRLAEGPIAIRSPDSRGNLRAIRLLESLAGARVASMRFALQDGDFDGVALAFDDAMALAQTLSYQGDGVNSAVAGIIAVTALHELSRELTEASFPPATCRALLATLDRRPLAPIELTIEGERASDTALIQRTYTDDGDGDGYAIPGLGLGIGGVVPTIPRNGLMRFLLAFQSRFIQASRREELARIDRTADMALREARRAPHEQWRDPATIEEASRPVDRRFALTAILGPRPGALSRRRVKTLVGTEGARTLIAIELFAAEHGRVPASLDELLPGLLPAVPIDPLSGEPLRYRRAGVPGGDPPAAFSLYSVGRDGVDDGGTFDPRMPHEAEQTDTEGVDLPIVIPRDPPPPRGG